MRKLGSRFISILLSFALVLGAAAGCSTKGSSTNQSESGESTIKVSSDFNPIGLPVMKKPITLKFLTSGGGAAVGNKSIRDKEFYKKISDETNVFIEWEEVTGASLTDRINLAIGSNDLPDALFARSMPNYADAIEGGLILALDEYINKYAPNEKKMFELYPSVKLHATYTGDGKVYIYTGVANKPEAALRAPIFINRIWLDYLGMKIPTTLDEYYNVLKAFKDKDPNMNGINDEIPLLLDRGNGTYEDFLALWGIIESGTVFHTGIKNGKLTFNPIDIRYKDALAYLNKLYSEGLLDNEIISGGVKNPRKKVVEKGSKKPVLLGSFTGHDIEMTIGAPNVKEYEAIPPLKGPAGERLWPYNPSELDAFDGLTIFKECKYPEAAIRWVDHLNDGINAITNAFGPENIAWKRDEATKTWWTLDDELQKKGSSITEIRNSETAGNGTAMGRVTEITGYNYKSSANSVEGMKNKWTEMYRPYFNKEYWPSGMPIFKSTKESQEIESLVTEFDKYLDTFVIDIIVKGQADQKWDEHIKKCKDLQTERIVKYYQERFNELKNVLKK